MAQAKKKAPAKKKASVKPKKATSEPITTDLEIVPKFKLSRLMALAVIEASGVGRLVYREQTRPNGPWQDDWQPVDRSGAYSLLAGGPTLDGRVAMVTWNLNNSGVTFIDEAEGGGKKGVPAWNKPVNLGTPKGWTFRNIYMGRHSDGRVEVFGISLEDGKLWWISQNPDRIVTRRVTVTPPGSDKPITITVQERKPPLKPWGKWQQLSEQSFSVIRLINDADDSMNIFGLGTGANDGELLWREQKKKPALTLGDWTPWVQLNKGGIGRFLDLATQLDANGSVNVFGIDATHQVAHIRQFPADSKTWTPWARPGIVREDVEAVIAGIDGDGDLTLIAQGKSNRIYGNSQISVEFAQWNTWQPIQMANGLGEMRMTYNADGRLSLFLRGTGKTGKSLMCTSQIAMNSTEWEALWTTLADNDVQHFAVVRDLTHTADPA